MNQKNPHTRLIVIVLALVCLAVAVFKPSFLLFILALAVIVGIGMFIGSFANELFDGVKWSWIVTLAVGLFVLYFIGTAFEGCSGPDPEWQY
jgi:membrane protein implicated in regulation of membrane protease activity